ncbi:helix-turn-helix domain-containing protein [Bosea sp. 685]|uniref:helix-turn-helix domain-containing protein n=1 Tax=Bosea sp. 685 TaxID=3080057 RepID=UPI003977A7D1
MQSAPTTYRHFTIRKQPASCPVTSGKTLWSYDGPTGQDVSLSEIARRLGIGKASVHRILKARKEMQAAS